MKKSGGHIPEPYDEEEAEFHHTRRYFRKPSPRRRRYRLKPLRAVRA